MIELKCDGCGSRLRAKDEHAGRTLKYPKCKPPVTVQAVISAAPIDAAPVPTPLPAAATQSSPVAVQSPPAPRPPDPAPAVVQKVAVQANQQKTQVRGKKKSNGMAYFLVGLFLVTGISWHRFYLGKYGSAVLQTFCFWFGLIGSFFLIGIPFIFIALIWLLIDMFGGTGRIVRKHNEQLA